MVIDSGIYIFRSVRYVAHEQLREAVGFSRSWCGGFHPRPAVETFPVQDFDSLEYRHRGLEWFVVQIIPQERFAMLCRACYCWSRGLRIDSAGDG
jgi:hypothetical protein